MTEHPLVIVHRDLGPGFTHFDSVECGCCPTVIEIKPETTAEEVHKAVERNERKQ